MAIFNRRSIKTAVAAGSQSPSFRHINGNLGKLKKSPTDVARISLHPLTTPPALLANLAVGDWAEASRIFAPEDVSVFSNLTYDHNQIHRESTASYERPIVHGLLVSSIFPALFSEVFPGAVYRSQDLVFRRPIPVDSIVTGRIDVERVRIIKNNSALVVCCTRCFIGTSSSGELVIDGKANVFISF
jgi:acyl dehydratase